MLLTTPRARRRGTAAAAAAARGASLARARARSTLGAPRDSGGAPFHFLEVALLVGVVFVVVKGSNVGAVGPGRAGPAR